MVSEKFHFKSTILGEESSGGSKNDLRRVARKLLNETVRNRPISKQETMCHLSQLLLFHCSEQIENVSIAVSFRLSTEK